jgi:5'-nucleotidase
MKPVVLVINDDGIESGFLRILVEVLIHHFEVRVVAPKTEQSWIGKAISRHREVGVEKREGFPCSAWAVDGTPADCVNIALGNLLQKEKIDAVVSGINIGFNASLPLVLSSGTIGGALEGALWGYHAVALSQVLSKEQFVEIQKRPSSLKPELEQSLREAAIRSVGFIQRAIDDKSRGSESVVVHNINFPIGLNADTQIVRCKAALNRGGSLFKESKQKPQSYVFRFSEGQNIGSTDKTDLNCLRQGHITYSLFDYTQLSDITSLSDNYESIESNSL